MVGFTFLFSQQTFLNWLPHSLNQDTKINVDGHRKKKGLVRTVVDAVLGEKPPDHADDEDCSLSANGKGSDVNGLTAIGENFVDAPLAPITRHNGVKEKRIDGNK